MRKVQIVLWIFKKALTDELTDITSDDDQPQAEEDEGITENSASEEAESSDNTHNPDQQS